MAGGWGQLQSLIRRKQGKSPELKLELELEDEPEEKDVAEKHSTSQLLLNRLPVSLSRVSGSRNGSPGRGRTPVAGPTPRGSVRGDIMGQGRGTYSRTASPEFAKAVALHNEKMNRADSDSSLSSLASGDEARAEQRVRHSLVKVLARGRGSGLLPSEPTSPPLTSTREPQSPNLSQQQQPATGAAPAAPQAASIGSLMTMVKLKKSVPKLVAASRIARRQTNTRHRSSQGRGSMNLMPGPAKIERSSLVPASLHTSLHHQESRRSSLGHHNFLGGDGGSLVAMANRAAEVPTTALGVGPEGRRSQHEVAPESAIKSLVSLSKAKRAGRLFLRLAGPGARLAFLKAHPFFRGTSESLRERLAPQLVRRSVEQVSSEVLRQGEEPQGSTDYLFLTSPDFAANIEVTLDNHPIAALSGDAVFGQEAIFGITKAFVFGIRVPTDVVPALWVIPRKTLKGLLVKDVFQADSRVLKERAHSTAIALLRAWYLHPISHLKIRLFDNAEHAFKHRLVQAVDMRLVASGASVCTEQETFSSCFCIFRGEAHVSIQGTRLARLSHSAGTSAWAAWWGTLEILDIAQRCPASVVAAADCIVWQLPQDRLQRLRMDYPMECRLFDKVAIEHMKTVQPFSLKIAESTHLKICDQRFLQELDKNCEKRIYNAGQLVMQEGEIGADCAEIYVLVRGKAEGPPVPERVRPEEVRKSLRNVFARSAAPSRAVSPGLDEERSSLRSSSKSNPTLTYDAMSTVPVATLTEGAMFGEIAALGVRDRRTATVVCSTICDIRVIKAQSMVQALTHFPEQGMQLERLSDNQSSHDDDLEVVDAEKLQEQGLFTGFSIEFLDQLGADMNSLVAFSGQPIVEQGAEVNAMFVLEAGRVAIEIEGARLCDLRAPAVIGETCLMEKGLKSMYTVRSRTHCHFKLIMAERGRQIIASFPQDQEVLEAFAAERLESLRMTICNKYHGVRPSVIAERQAIKSPCEDDYNDDDSSADGEAPPDWWIDTIFKESDREFIDFLSVNLKKTIYFHDEVILQEGDEGDCAIILQVGGGVVEVGGARVSEVKAGSIVGEAVMLGYATTRTATVRAVGLTSAVSLSRDIVLESLQQHPDEMQRVEHMMMIRCSTNKLLASSKDKEGGKGNAISVGGIQMGVMGGSAIKTMKQMAMRRSTTVLDVREIQKQLGSGSRRNSRSGCSSSRKNSISRDKDDRSESPEIERVVTRVKRRLRTSAGIMMGSNCGSRVGSFSRTPGGSRAGSCIGSRVGSRVGSALSSVSNSRAGTPPEQMRSRAGSRNPSRGPSIAGSPMASRPGSSSSSSADGAERSRMPSLKSAISEAKKSFTERLASPRPSVDQSNRRNSRSRGSITTCVAPNLQSDLRASARKLKKHAPSISVLPETMNKAATMDDAALRQDSPEEDRPSRQTIQNIADLMLHPKPSKSQTRPLSGGSERGITRESLPEGRDRSDSLLTTRSYTVMGLRQRPQSGNTHNRSSLGTDMVGNANPRATLSSKVTVELPPSKIATEAEAPVETDVEMAPEDLVPNEQMRNEQTRGSQAGSRNDQIRISLSVPGSSMSHRVSDSCLTVKAAQLEAAMARKTLPANKNMSTLESVKSRPESVSSMEEEDDESLNLDEADLDCDLYGEANRHTIIFTQDLQMKEDSETKKSKEYTEWVDKRRKMIEAAPMRQAYRLARRGDYLPLVPGNMGYQEDGSAPQSNAAKIAARRCGTAPTGTSRKLLTAQGVYLRARRWDIRRK